MKKREEAQKKSYPKDSILYACAGLGDNEAIVRVKVLRPQKPAARLEFGMRRNDGKWKIVDVKANGTSAVLYYRSHFMAELRGYGDRNYAEQRRDYVR